MNERCPCLEKPEFFNDDGICRSCPWRLVAAVLSGRGVPIARKDFIRSCVASLNGEREPEIVEAIVRNYCVPRSIAKVALRRAIRSYRLEKLREKR